MTKPSKMWLFLANTATNYKRTLLAANVDIILISKKKYFHNVVSFEYFISFCIISLSEWQLSLINVLVDEMMFDHNPELI